MAAQNKSVWLITKDLKIKKFSISIKQYNSSSPSKFDGYISLADGYSICTRVIFDTRKEAKDFLKVIVYNYSQMFRLWALELSKLI